MPTVRELARIAVLAIAIVVIVSGAVIAGGRHAGTVVSVDPATGALKVDELGLAAVRQTLDLTVAPNADIALVERVEPVVDFDRAWRRTPLRLADVRPGDYVVVEIGDQPGAVRRLTVTLRASAPRS
jgi:hypothetical protein